MTAAPADGGDLDFGRGRIAEVPCLSRGETRHGVAMACTSAGFFSLHRKISRDVAANALWRAFPSPSEHALCIRAASVLDTSPDTIRRIIRKDTDAKLSLIWPVLALAMASRGIDVLDVVDGEP